MVIVNEEIRGDLDSETTNDVLTNSQKGYTKMVGLKGNDTYIIKNAATLSRIFFYEIF